MILFLVTLIFRVFNNTVPLIESKNQNSLDQKKIKKVKRKKLKSKGREFMNSKNILLNEGRTLKYL